MKTRIRNIIASAVLAFAIVALPATIAPVVYAGSNVDAVCAGIDGIDNSNSNDCTDREAGQLSTFIKRIINILLFIIGAIAVLMIIIGGIRYVTSGGDANQTKGARDTILYAVIGVIIAIMAFAIVNFVVGSI